MNNAWFVTGTDTEVGKTLVTCALLHAVQARGRRAIGMKPIAAGCDAHGRNEDVEAICAASHPAADRRLINPYLLQAAVAPHIAARAEGIDIATETIMTSFRQLAALAEVVVVEGVGGFRVPLNDRQDSADLAVALDLPVILVIGLRLGCLNHALLTVEAIAARGLQLAGWVANQIDPRMPHLPENLQALQQRIPAPLLGHIPRLPAPTAERAASHLQLDDARLLP